MFKVYKIFNSQSRKGGRQNNRGELVPIWSWKQLKCKRWLKELSGGGRKSKQSWALKRKTK